MSLQDASAPDGVVTDDDGFAAASPSRRLEIASAAVPLVLSVVLLLGARRIGLRTETGGIDPRWWPEVLGGAGIVLSTALLATAVLRPPAARGEVESISPQGLRRLALTVAASAAAVVLWTLVGFLPAAVVLVAGLVALFGGRGWKALVAFPVLLAAFLHLVFAVLLEVPL